MQQKYTFTTADPNASVNTLSCAASPPTLTAQAGILKDPGGDSNYPASLTCTQSVFVSGVTGVEIVFEDLDTEVGGDLITITDVNGALLTFSGATLPAPFLVADGFFNVRFTANSNATVGRGFRLRWRAVTVSDSPATPATAFGNAFQFDVQKGALLSGYLTTGAVQRAGLFSTAMGIGNTASGTYSTAMGVFNTASGFAATAMGDGNTARG
ncbi:MAG: hypothetical protein LH609_10655 [Rudanella sp.]|nr:hypothetical protein [Rudanella sp.]